MNIKYYTKYKSTTFVLIDLKKIVTQYKNFEGS